MKSPGRRVAVLLAALVGLALGAAVAVFVAGVTLDVSRWRDTAAQRASAALGRPVALQGALQLTLGRELVLRAGAVQVGNPPGFESPWFATIDAARVRIDLLDALRGRLRLRSVEAGDVGLWLERTADGRGNWSPATPREPGSAAAAPQIGKIELQRATVHLLDADRATRRKAEFESVYARTAPDGALHLALRGLVDARPAYRLQLDGGPLHLLQQGAEPWPFKLELRASGARLQASGLLDAQQAEARFDFDAHLDDAARVGPALGLALPQAGMAWLRGRARVAADGVALTGLQGTLPGADFSGQLALALGAARPRLSGALQFGDVDLQPWREALAAARQAPAAPAAGDWQALALRDLPAWDVDLLLGVQQWLGLPVPLREARIALRADAQGVHAPLQATVAGAPVTGRLDLDTAAGTPTLALALSASELPLGELLRGLAGEGRDAAAIDGTLGRLTARFDGRGETLGAWLQGLDAAVAASALDLRLDRGPAARPLALRLDELTLQARGGGRLQGRARGTALGEPVTVALRAGRPADLLLAPGLPIELDLNTAPAMLRIATDLAAAPADAGRTLGFDFRASRSGDLARWLGVAPESALPLAARGRLRLADEAWQLDATSLQLGRSRLLVDAHGPRAAAEMRGTRPTVRVRGELLDLPELMSLQAAAVAAAPAEPRGAPPPAVPAVLAEADLELELQQLRLGRPTLQDVGLRAQVRQGRLLPSPFRGRVAGTAFDGTLGLELRDAEPQARLELSAREVDVGVLLHALGLAEGIVDGRAEALQFSLQGRGRGWRAFVEGAELQARLLGGNIEVHPPLQRPVAAIRLRSAALGAAPGEPLRLRLDGALKRTPLQIELRTGTLGELLQDDRPLPFALSARAADTLLTLDGEAALPLGRDARLRLQMSGERLDSLGELARVELPAWGPWSITGPIRMTPLGYAVHDLQLHVGSSRLDGSGQLDLSGPRPHLALQVSAPRIQLDDFPLPQRLVDPQERPDPPAGGVRGLAGGIAGRADRMLSARFLRRVDASIDVQAQEVLAGADRLADGSLRLRLREGRLDLDPAVLNLPGGSLRLTIAYDLKESELDFAIAADVERFDYGIIARRLGRADDVRGLFSMRMQMHGRAPSLDTIMRQADGELDVALWPTELRAGVFNFWSVNLVLKLLPMIDPRAASQVNCIIGRFDLKDGVVRDDKIVIDTTAVRIRGAGQANLATEELDFVFRPRSKGVAVFRLQNPLRVTGTLGDQRIGLDPRDSVESTLRLIASPILWPIERLTLGPLPRDGADICTDPLRAAGR